MKCWDNHKPEGMVSNRDMFDPEDRLRYPMAAIACCSRPNCVASAKRQVRRKTGEAGVFQPYRSEP